MQQQIFDMLINQDEVSWKTIIYDLVKTEKMDPWDINLTLLTKKFIKIIKEMKEHEFKISGKILLAAAVLLKIKVTHLVDNDFTKLDQLISQTEEEVFDEEVFEESEMRPNNKKNQKFNLIPRNPQPRNRKVSIQDLVNALQRAMNTKRKILAQQRPVKFEHVYGKKVDIMEVILDIYHKITYYSNKDKNNKDKSDKITFSKLLPPKAGKPEKVYTFIPLLHLENQEKILTEQEAPFEEIHISLSKKEKAR